MVTKKANLTYTLEQFNSEINELFDQMKSENYNDEEIKKTFSPLTSKIKKSNTPTYVFTALIALFVSVYLLTYFDSFYWHVSAIGRIALIKALPFFDWRYLKNKKCLIDKFTLPGNPILPLNCDVCENIKDIHVYENIDEDTLTQRYLELDTPVLLTKGLENWANRSSFIEDLIADDVFYYSYPCKLSTNIHKGSCPTGELLEKAKAFDEFFLHFQNCELEAMKIFRRYTYRPTFLPAIYSPILYNWLVWNRAYNATNYKRIDLVEQLVVFGQLFGTSFVRLTPKGQCQSVCPILNVALHGGESLVFTNLWNLEYRPGEVGENMAAILETNN